MKASNERNERTNNMNMNMKNNINTNIIHSNSNGIQFNWIDLFDGIK